MVDALILGGGPSGGTVALGLRRLGYSVTVVTQARPFEALEGISERVVAGLRGAGFHHALSAIPEPTSRQALWNGEHTQANTERLIHRPTLDRGILLDLEDSGVQVIPGHVGRVAKSPQGYQVDIQSGTDHRRLTAGFLVEARGRRAPSQGRSRMRGAETVALLQVWQGPPLSPASAVESFAQGWAWMAASEGGQRYLQTTLDAAQPTLPAREQLGEFLRQRLAGLACAQAFLTGAHPIGAVVARASTAILQQESVGEDWIRVGDAAMAVDPLSGNGIFQALSSALIAPAVINTLLGRPAQGALARAFYRQRLAHLFLRFARLGRDFYRLEQRWAAQSFWSARAAWPDDLPVHESPQQRPVEIAQRPVVNEGYIETQAVLITADQPLGVWQVAGIAMAPLVEQLRQEPLSRGASPQQQLCRRWSMSPAQARQVLAWLGQYRLLNGG